MIKNAALLLLFVFPTICQAQRCIKSPSEFRTVAIPILLTHDASEKNTENSFRRFIDFEIISKNTLRSKSNKAISSKKLSEFQELLEALMVSTLVRVVSAQPDATFEYTFVDRRYFVIHTEITKEEVETELSLKVGKNKQDCWKVFDIIIDEVSMSSNYKEQFQSIVAKHGFDVLLVKMRKKLKSLKA